MAQRGRFGRGPRAGVTGGGMGRPAPTRPPQFGMQPPVTAYPARVQRPLGAAMGPPAPVMGAPVAPTVTRCPTCGGRGIVRSGGFR